MPSLILLLTSFFLAETAVRLLHRPGPGRFNCFDDSSKSLKLEMFYTWSLKTLATSITIQSNEQQLTRKTFMKEEVKPPPTRSYIQALSANNPYSFHTSKALENLWTSIKRVIWTKLESKVSHSTFTVSIQRETQSRTNDWKL